MKKQANDQSNSRCVPYQPIIIINNVKNSLTPAKPEYLIGEKKNDGSYAYFMTKRKFPFLTREWMSEVRAISLLLHGLLLPLLLLLPPSNGNK
jgi:hypothetical protein